MLDSSITKRKDGRVELRITIGKDASGKRIRKSLYGKNEREVKKKKDEWLKTYSVSEREYSQTIGFSAWADKWLIVYKQDTVREYTYENTYRTRVEKYLKPYFRQRPIDSITPLDIQAFFNKHRSLSLALLKTLKVILNDIFNKAIDNDFCLKNPVTNVRIQSTQKSKERQALNAKEHDRAIKWAIANKRFVILTVLKTGIRRGELLGLKWSDIDFQRMLIDINESISPPVRSGGAIDYEVKSLASNRQIPIDKELADCLKSMPQDSERVFNCTNANVYGKNIKAVLMQMSEECGTPFLTLHELRHTFGTVLREKGVDIYTISKLMGHSSINVTASIYVHNDIEVLRRAIMSDANISSDVQFDCQNDQ